MPTASAGIPAVPSTVSLSADSSLSSIAVYLFLAFLNIAVFFVYLECHQASLSHIHSHVDSKNAMLLFKKRKDIFFAFEIEFD